MNNNRSGAFGAAPAFPRLTFVQRLRQLFSSRSKTGRFVNPSLLMEMGMRGWFPNGIQWGNSENSDRNITDADAAQLYAASITAWTAINYRAAATASIPIMIVNEDEQEYIGWEDDPLSRWIERHARDLIYQCVISELVWGKWFLQKLRNVNDVPTRLRFLSPVLVQANIDMALEHPEIVGFMVSEAGGSGRLEVEDVVHWFGFDPFQDFNPTSPLKSLFNQTRSDASLTRFINKFFENNAFLGGLLTYSGNLTESDQKLVQQQFSEQFRGPWNAGKTMVVGAPDVAWTYQPFQNATSVPAMPELKDVLISDICVGLGVPPQLLGRGDAADPLSAQNTMRQIETSWLQTHVIPAAERIIAELNEQWVRDFDGIYPQTMRLRLDTSQIISASSATPERIAAAHTLAADGLWSITEIREYLGKTEDVFLLPTNSATIYAGYSGGLLQLNEARAMLGLPSAERDGWIYNLDPRAASSPQPALSASGVRARRSDALDALRAWRVNPNADPPGSLPKSIVQYVSRNLAEQWNADAVFSEAERALRVNRKPRPQGASPIATNNWWRMYDALEQKDKLGIADAFEKYMAAVWEMIGDPALLTPSGLNAALQMQQTVFKSAFKSSGQALLAAGWRNGEHALIADNRRAFDVPELAVPLDDIYSHLNKYLDTYVDYLLKKLNETTESRFASLVDKMRSGDLTSEAFGASLNNLLQPNNPKLTGRAKTIANSESARLYNMAGLARWRDANVRRVRFETVRDDHVCPTCRGLHHTVVDIDDGFKNIDGSKTFPPMHSACRCGMKPVLS